MTHSERMPCWLLRGLLILALVLLSGCSPTELKTQATQVPQLVLSTLTGPNTFNYANNQSFPHIFLLTSEGLTRENGSTGELEPGLAESWQFSTDQRRVVFTLRPDLKWSDGQPLTAADVVFTFNEVVFNPLVPADAKDSLRIGKAGEFPQVRQLDDRRVEFLLPEPFAPLLRSVASPDGVVILPRHALAEAVRTKGPDGNLRFVSTWNTDTDPTQVIVNGPYRLESYTPGERLIFRRNPYYWRRDAEGKPLPYIERIVWQFIESTDTQLIRFRSGDLDVIGDSRPLRPEYFSLLKREERRGKFRIYDGGPWSGVLYMTFNLNQARNDKGQPFVDPIKSRWFNTLAFRKAVAHAIDRERMNTNIFRGLGIIQNSPVSVQSPYFLRGEDGLPVYDYNLQKAKELLQQAGFRYNPQGQLLDWDGNRVQFTLLTNAGNKVREAIGSQIRQDLSRIGIQVDFTPINFNTLIERTSSNRDWEAHMLGFTGGVEPHEAANLWLSRGGSHSFNLSQQPGLPPISGWKANDWELEIDRLLWAGARELDETKRKAIYAQFQTLVQEQLPVIFLVNDRAMMAVRDKVQGLRYTGLPSWGLWNIQELTINSARPQ